MSAIKIVARPNGDDVVLAWRTERIDNCIGFALERQVRGKEAEYLETELPFAGQEATKGERRPCTQWPIQRFVWTDHLAPHKVDLKYRVRPVYGTPDSPTPAKAAEASAWTSWIRCETMSTPGYSLFPNRGIGASQWVEDEIEELRAATPGVSDASLLSTAISTTGSRLRERLAGPVLGAIRAQFALAANRNEDIYAALYELRDDELIDLLCTAGSRAHVVLANGAFSKEDPDPNADAAKRLRNAHVDVTRRIVGAGHFAHNKFVVFGAGDQRRVWTGSTNWTPSGLCTQANHAVLVEDPVLADAYVAYWNRIRSSLDGYPASFKAANAVPGRGTEGAIETRAWFTPVPKQVDMEDARALIRGAQHGALFLMFRPGDSETLIDEIKALNGKGKFIRGVANQNFLGKQSAPTIDFFNKSAKALEVNPSILLPARLSAAVGALDKEVAASGVLIHSKIVVLDPFGDHPVVMTGSHNLGTKASAKNDDNLLIIENAPGLAQEFAVYIMNTYDHYRWRYEKALREKPGVQGVAGSMPPAGKWKGLIPSDKWQNASYLKKSAKEVSFWFKQ